MNAQLKKRELAATPVPKLQHVLPLLLRGKFNKKKLGAICKMFSSNPLLSSILLIKCTPPKSDNEDEEDEKDDEDDNEETMDDDEDAGSQENEEGVDNDEDETGCQTSIVWAERKRWRNREDIQEETS